MIDFNITYMLGYVSAKGWASAIQIARNDKRSGLSQFALWELIKEQDEIYASNMTDEVIALLGE
jgi:hypothetical protein